MLRTLAKTTGTASTPEEAEHAIEAFGRAFPKGTFAVGTELYLCKSADGYLQIMSSNVQNCLAYMFLSFVSSIHAHC